MTQQRAKQASKPSPANSPSKRCSFDVQIKASKNNKGVSQPCGNLKTFWFGSVFGFTESQINHLQEVVISEPNRNEAPNTHTQTCCSRLASPLRHRSPHNLQRTDKNTRGKKVPPTRLTGKSSSEAHLSTHTCPCAHASKPVMFHQSLWRPLKHRLTQRQARGRRPRTLQRRLPSPQPPPPTQLHLANCGDATHRDAERQVTRGRRCVCV